MKKTNGHANRRSGEGGLVRRSSKSAGGFTLLEIIIAMSILAISMLGIIKMQMVVGSSNVQSRNLSAALNLCRGKLEDMRRIRAYYILAAASPTTICDTDLTSPDTGNDLSDWTSPDHDEGGTINEAGQAGGIFTRAWNVVDDIPAPNIKTVRVRVAWQEGSTSRFVELDTQIARKNINYYQ